MDFYQLHIYINSSDDIFLVYKFTVTIDIEWTKYWNDLIENTEEKGKRKKELIID